MILNIKMFSPVKIDCKNLRVERQRENNRIMFHALISQNEELVRYHCNINELSRVLTELCEALMQPITFKYLLEKSSKDHVYAFTLARQISKKASRQATKDESYILEKCNQTVSQVGIKIENLTTTAFRPTKDGRILNNKQYKKSGLNKSDCLKSFDARISGRVNGWVFAKISYGTGGHQDNVFIEANEFGIWAQQYGKENELYVILIDTDQTLRFQDLKQKFTQPNILVCNHFDFQIILFNQIF